MIHTDVTYVNVFLTAKNKSAKAPDFSCIATQPIKGYNDSMLD